MAAVLPATPPSPGVGTRRKGPKSLPKLPLSAFASPTSGTSDQFPLPRDPSTVHPDNVVDAAVTLLDGDFALARWRMEAGSSKILGSRVAGVVVTLPSADDIPKLNKATKILRVLLPFSLDSEDHDPLPSSAGLTTSFTEVTSASVPSLRWALQQGATVDISVDRPFNESLFESFEDLISKSVTDLDKVPPIILSNMLPPLDDLSLPIVKLMNHPTYRAFQARVAALSLIPQLYVKFLAPAWDIQIPETPSLMSPGEQPESRERKEWKRRIKMYLGPVLEAFGYERIIFGSSPSGSNRGLCGAGEWYEIARESLAELAVEQEAIDAVFSRTAQKIYGA